MLGKKGNLTLYVISFFFGLIFVVVAGLLAPFGVLINTEIYQAGEMIMLQANDSLQNIQNDTVSERIQGVINSGLAATEDNIEVNNDVYQYGWIAFLIIFFVLVFLGARQIKETSGGIA